MSQTNCVNYELCCNEAVSDGLCVLCKKLGGVKLSIIDGLSECAICFREGKRKLEFPAGCGHAFCLNCSRYILFGDDTRFYVSPVAYGCPPCPKGCANPIIGRQCECLDYVCIKEIWETTDLFGAANWLTDEAKSVAAGRWLDVSSYGGCVCPLCRKAVKAS
jgi:hypothetical protein